MDGNLPGSSVHGILQARTLGWAAISFYRGSSPARDQTWVSCTADRFFNIRAPREVHSKWGRRNQMVTKLECLMRLIRILYLSPRVASIDFLVLWSHRVLSHLVRHVREARWRDVRWIIKVNEKVWHSEKSMSLKTRKLILILLLTSFKNLDRLLNLCLTFFKFKTQGYIKQFVPSPPVPKS